MRDGRRGVTAAVILAAGASTRLGSPKQLATIGSETLLDRTIRIAKQACCDPVIVVLGANAEQIQATCNLTQTQLALNPEWAEGMGSSLRVGVAHLQPDLARLVVLTCDQPAVTADHLSRLIQKSAESGSIVASSYGKKRGVPACFPAKSFPSLLQLGGDTGARALLVSADTLDLPAGELDVDTAELLEEARQRFG
jgi:molybdenum cofactor cytidylyltransferase